MTKKVWDYSGQPAETSAEVTAELDKLIASSTITQVTNLSPKAKARQELFGQTPAVLVPLAERKGYTNEELVQWILDHPGCTHAEIGAAYGRTAGWFSTVLVTDDFQEALAPARAAIRDPSITATMEQRFAGLLVRSVDVLQVKLSGANPDASLVMEAAKLGVRALGLGNAGRDAPAQSAPQSLESLADRLTGLITNRTKGSGIGSVPQATVIDVQAKEG